MTTLSKDTSFEFSGLDNEIQRVTGAINDNKASIEKNIEKHAKFASGVREKYTLGLTAASKAMNSALEDRKKALKAAEDDIADYTAQQLDEFKKLVSGASDAAKATETVSKTVKKSVEEQYKAAQAAVSTHKQAMADLKGQLAAGLITQTQYNSAVDAAKEKLQGVTGAAKLFASEAQKTSGAAGGAGKKFKDMGSAGKKAAKDLAAAAKRELQQFNDGLASLFGQLFPGRQLMLDMRADALKLSRALSGDGAKAMQKYGLSAGDVNVKLSELQVIIEKFSTGKISQEAAKKLFDNMKRGVESVSDETNVMTEQFKRAVESIDSSFADMWKNILSGGKISFENLASTIKNIFAEIMHSITTKPLTGWIMDSVTGEVTEKRRW